MHEFDRVDNIGGFLQIWLNNELLSPDSQRRIERYYRRWRRMNSDRLRFWYNNQLSEVERILSQYEQPRLLEIGIGKGTECLWFALRGVDVTGIDKSSKAIRVATERQRVLEKILGRELICSIEMVSLLDYHCAEGFDVIWLEQAFHHLEPRDEVVRRLGALLKPGGAIVLQEANAWNPLIQLLLVKKRGFNVVRVIETENGTRQFGRERILTARTLARHLRSQDIETRSVRYFRIFPAHWIFDIFFGLERFMSRRLNVGPFVPMFTHYNFVGRKSSVDGT